VVVGLLLGARPADAHETARLEYPDGFELPASLAFRVQFWIDVFTRYSLREAVVHDRAHPERVLAVVPLKVGDSAELAEIKASYEEVIREVANAPSFTSSPFLSLFLPPVDPSAIAAAAGIDRVRVQPGQREVFAKSIIRSRRYLDGIRREFSRAGLPQTLAYLPHVESSFDSEARSSAGAVGIWQLMADTARPVIRVDDEVDERTYPVKATLAAAAYLTRAYVALGNWPLALTAYNYGIAGTVRAVQSVGADDLTDLIAHHDGVNWGFACKNFYAQFLAAVHVAENTGDYFPELVYPNGIEHVVRKGDTLWHLSRRYGVPIESIRESNALSRATQLRLGQRLMIRG
jgi:membrane-bound lytic murein transglycosylase D